MKGLAKDGPSGNGFPPSKSASSGADEFNSSKTDSMKKRSTVDLAKELIERTAAAIIVGFEKETKYIWRQSKELEVIVNELNELVVAGGEPIGLVFQEGGRISLQPLREYSQAVWVRKYLTSLIGSIELALVGKAKTSSSASDLTAGLSEELHCDCACPYFGKAHDHRWVCECQCGKEEVCCGYCMEAGRITQCLECGQKQSLN